MEEVVAIREGDTNRNGKRTPGERASWHPAAPAAGRVVGRLPSICREVCGPRRRADAAGAAGASLLTGPCV